MGPFDSPFFEGEMNGLAGLMPENDSGEYMAGWFSGQQMAEDDLDKTALDNEDEDEDIDDDDGDGFELEDDFDLDEDFDDDSDDF